MCAALFNIQFSNNLNFWIAIRNSLNVKPNFHAGYFWQILIYNLRKKVDKKVYLQSIIGAKTMQFYNANLNTKIKKY